MTTATVRPAIQTHTNGVSKPESPPSEMSLFDQLLADLSKIDDAGDARKWALSNVAQLTHVQLVQRANIFERLIDLGVTQTWIRTELKPVVHDERKQAQSGETATGVTWEDYVRAANRLGYAFRLNDMDDSLEVNGQRMSDTLEAVILSNLHAVGFKGVDVARRAFLTDANENRYHPVHDFLEALEWDGADHIAALARYFDDSHELITYGDMLKRTVFHAWLRRWLVGAVAKSYQKSQNPMLILDGAQGRGKSHFVQWLASPMSQLFIEGPIKPDNNDHLDYLMSNWIWEVSELGATMRRSDRESLKDFVTKRTVVNRSAYGRYHNRKPALASFIGTVNVEHGLLNDPTGHRRFRPVEVIGIDWTYADNIDVRQVWAQAYALFRQGETCDLSSEEKAAHETIAEIYEVENPMEGHIQKWFSVDPASGEYMPTATIIQHLRFHASVRGSDRGVSMEVATILKAMGLRREKRTVGETRAWGYVGIAPVKELPI